MSVDNSAMREMRLCGVEVYAVELDISATSNIRDAERLGVEALVLHRFGSGVRVFHHPSGVPYLDYVNRSDCYPQLPAISLSHGGGWAVMAVAPPGEYVGIDIEAPRIQLHRVLDRFLSLSEKERWDYTSLTVLQWLWTVKEAVYKASLTPGLPLKEIEVLTSSLTLVHPIETEFITASLSLSDCTITVARHKNTVPDNQNSETRC